MVTRRIIEVLGLSLWLSLPFGVQAQYAGSTACRGCHPAQFDSQSRTGHARALALAPAGSPGHWAFGAGLKATTYVSQIDRDSYMEHGLSYYASTRSLALTPGHKNTAGVRYPTFDAEATTLKCFGCHSTGPLSLGPGDAIQPSEPGVHCESCHGPGANHVRTDGAPGTILNPKLLNAVEANELCGTCHRKPPEGDWTDPWKTRHQPSYLSQSACFRKSRGALSCVTCHDPHGALNETPRDYDKRCSQCHSGVRHRTAIASQACVVCHMPQVIASAQLKFTNHWIGIYGAHNTLVPARSLAKNLPPIYKAAKQSDTSGLRVLFEQALAEREKELGPNASDVARRASALGRLLSNSGKPAEAEAPLRRALKIDESNSDPAVSSDREQLALTLHTIGKGDEAFELFQRAGSGPDPSVSARCYATLAMLDPAQAESYYRNALEAEQKASGPSHPRVAVLLGDLALTLQAKKDYQAAEALFRRALAIQRQALGSDNPATASTLSNLGSLLQTKGQLAQAEQVERAAMRIFEEKLGPNSAELATACTNLADVLWAKGERLASAKLYRRAISIDESVYGPENPEVAGDLVNLGLLLKESGERAEAESLLRRALAINERAFGPGSSQAQQIRRELLVAPR